MLPGWINNTYALETCQIDLQNLCSRAGVTFILGKLAHFNAQQQQLVLHDESALDYDLLSLAIGSQPNLVGDIAALNEWVAVKPFDAYTQTWQTWQQQLNLKLPATLTIAGGGAGAHQGPDGDGYLAALTNFRFIIHTEIHSNIFYTFYVFDKEFFLHLSECV